MLENDKNRTFKDYKNFKQMGFVKFSRGVSLPSYINDSIKTNYHDLGQRLSKVIEKNEKFKDAIKLFEKKENDNTKLTIKKHLVINKVKDLQS